MFSFKTLQINLRRVIPTLLVTLGLLLLLEMRFRAGDWFYDYEGWESPGLMKKMEGAEKLFEEKGRIDLVTMSTSVGRIWDVRQWEEATSGSIVGYNFGFPDQRPERQFFLFKNHIYPKYHPTHVIYGINAGDVNGNINGMNPKNPQQGAFWTYRKIRALGNKTILDKIVTKLENWSAMFRGRQRARFTLQYGRVWMLEEEPTIGRGVLVPTVRRQAYGPMIESWGRKPEGFKNNPYHDYWVPDDGEIGELLKLSNFCKEHDIKLAIVEVPSSPYGHTNFDNPDEDYWRFTNALEYLSANGAWVLPMARDLKLDNTYYEDPVHLNRWGAEIVTDYVYQNVIKKWYPDEASAPALAVPVELWFEDLVTSATSGVEIARLKTATEDAQYAADRQVIVSEPVDIPLSASLAAGSYAVELYAGDGSTSGVLLSGGAKLDLAAVGETGETLATMPIDHWINSRIGIAYTQVYFTLPTTSTLTLRVADVGSHSVILDSVFIRPRLANLGDKIIVE